MAAGFWWFGAVPGGTLVFQMEVAKPVLHRCRLEQGGGLWLPVHKGFLFPANVGLASHLRKEGEGGSHSKNRNHLEDYCTLFPSLELLLLGILHDFPTFLGFFAGFKYEGHSLGGFVFYGKFRIPLLGRVNYYGFLWTAGEEQNQQTQDWNSYCYFHGFIPLRRYQV